MRAVVTLPLLHHSDSAFCVQNACQWQLKRCCDAYKVAVTRQHRARSYCRWTNIRYHCIRRVACARCDCARANAQEMLRGTAHLIRTVYTRTGLPTCCDSTFLVTRWAPNAMISCLLILLLISFSASVSRPGVPRLAAAKMRV